MVKNKKTITFIGMIIIYLIFKGYVLYTETPADDNIPDEILKTLLSSN